MNVPLWAIQLASGFWQDAGEVEQFPRDLRRPARRALSVSFIDLAGLSVARVIDWLGTLNICCRLDEPDRALRACLVARDGHGFVFIDAADPPDERRFSQAHELAHFLRDYREPRRRASRGVGTQVLEVFDGRRPPTAPERFHALLAFVPIAEHVHLMRRDEDGELPAGIVTAAERDADRLACELLAPVAAIQSWRGDRTELVEVLRMTYGLPARAAREYANILVPARPTDPLLRYLH